jgi:Ca-activated chloride channel family protein
MNTMTGSFSIQNVANNEDVKLSMQALRLTGRILPAGARLLVTHTFRSQEQKPLEAVYSFGLPRDATLCRFKMVGEDFEMASELRPVEEAQKEYEQGIQKGHLSGLARLYRDGRVNLNVGNIRPGELVKVMVEMVAGVERRDDGLRFRFPFTLAPCYHSQARAIAIAPDQMEMELPGDQFGDMLLPRWMEAAATLHGVSFQLEVAMQSAISGIASPSHALNMKGIGNSIVLVGLSPEKDVPDRDLVLDVQLPEPRTVVCGGWSDSGKGHCTIVVPSVNFGKKSAGSKTVIFILDRSGSMEGAPLEQAKRAVSACLATLRESDEFGLVAFDDHTELFHKAPMKATMENRDKALKFLERVDARGGTEMEQALRAGFDLAGKKPADFFLVTDGQVSATENIIQHMKQAEMRIYCLGIGAASQDRFLTLLARNTGGECRFLSPRERVDIGALELFAGVGHPVASNLHVNFKGDLDAGTVVPPRTTVHEGQPFEIMVEAEKRGRGILELTWGEKTETHHMEIELDLQDDPEAETVKKLQGARLITDQDASLEAEITSLSDQGTEGRQKKRALARLQELSTYYGLASRAMSLVAVVKRKGDSGRELPVTRVVPVGLPEDMKVSAYAGHAKQQCCYDSAPPSTARVQFMARRSYRVAEHADVSAMHDPKHKGKQEFMMPAITSNNDFLLSEVVGYAAKLLPDGGLPGVDLDDRVVRSCQLLLVFTYLGHSSTTGAFRVHAKNMAEFIHQNLAKLSLPRYREVAEKCLKNVQQGIPENNRLAGEVYQLIEDYAPPAQAWQRLERLF